MATKRRGSAAAKDGVRRAWFAAYRDTLTGIPGINDDVTDAGRALLDDLCRRMHALGLFGVSAHGERQREIVRRLVSEFRGEQTDVRW